MTTLDKEVPQIGEPPSAELRPSDKLSKNSGRLRTSSRRLWTNLS